ncbi:MAG: polyprenyl synthetase family protein [Hyphomicrobiaceae bacterium]
MTFAEKLAETTAVVEQRLEKALNAEADAGTPDRLLSAMRHALLLGGKRFRPFLVLETTRILGGNNKFSIEIAAAIECIHAYSLVHDDLPAMDNDELRRGVATVWKQYDEWTAILVGDALQSLAFQLIASPPSHNDSQTRTKLAVALAKASGGAGMVGGQMLDLDTERVSTQPTPTAEKIVHLQSMKTGRLITFSCQAGALISGANQAHHKAIVTYGDQLGLAFQIADDLLDAEGDAAVVGKAVAKDQDQGKATLVGILGVDRARAELARVEQAALTALDCFGSEANVLREAARFVVHRKS